jgi:hypothetical protein
MLHQQTNPQTWLSILFLGQRCKFFVFAYKKTEFNNTDLSRIFIGVNQLRVLHFLPLAVAVLLVLGNIAPILDESLCGVTQFLHLEGPVHSVPSLHPLAEAAFTR